MVFLRFNPFGDLTTHMEPLQVLPISVPFGMHHDIVFPVIKNEIYPKRPFRNAS
ncbi:MAG: hypothetical protein RRB18_07740 [Sulfolobaceae archaeon]|nr:hypothetical protein [Sulfolobaceae archaeon]